MSAVVFLQVELVALRVSLTDLIGCRAFWASVRRGALFALGRGVGPLDPGHGELALGLP